GEARVGWKDMQLLLDYYEQQLTPGTQEFVRAGRLEILATAKGWSTYKYVGTNVSGGYLPVEISGPSLSTPLLRATTLPDLSAFPAPRSASPGLPPSCT